MIISKRAINKRNDENKSPNSTFSARSPIFSHANATLQGLSTIRAFKAQQILSNEFDTHQDLNTSSWYLFLASTRAFALWLELVCVLYMATVILSFLFLGNGTLFTLPSNYYDIFG